MKKIIKKFGFIAFLLLTNPAYAGLGGLWPDEIPKKDVLEIMNLIINGLLGIVGAVAVWFLIVGGSQYITSAGNPEQVAKAKNTIMYAIIGLIVVILALAIVNFVITSLV